MLEQYPNDVIVYVTDPRTGVQRHLKWPPTISEIVEACDNRISEIRRREKFERWGQQNISLLEAPRDKRPTLDQLKEKYGDNWGLTPHEPRKVAPAPTWDQITSAYKADPTRIAKLVEIADRHREASTPSD